MNKQIKNNASAPLWQIPPDAKAGRMRGFINSDGFVNAFASLISIVIGILFGLLILLISNPSQAFAGLGYILRGGFSGGAKGIGQVLYFSTPIIMTGLSVGFAFKTGLFNIGASGQFLAGAFVAIFIGVKWTFLPAGIHWIVALLGGMLAGGVWALIPGIFKAFLNVNEVISCIMMNYIGLYGVNYLTKLHIYDAAKTLSMNVAPSAVIPKGGLDKIFYNAVGTTRDISTLNAGFYIAIAVAIIMYIVLNKTTFGYELKACGLNRHASRYAGINEKRNIVFSMFISGMLSGLGGALLYLSGANGRRIKVVDALATEGFQGISVALLGLSNPIGIIFAGLFISYITIGGDYMQRLDFVPEIIEIIIAAIIYFSAFSMMFRGIIKKLITGQYGKKRKKLAKNTEQEGK